jgi:hypothetical protein
MVVPKGATTKQTGAADPVIQKAAQADPVPWYKKPNLRHLYFMLFPTCMGIELTSGFGERHLPELEQSIAYSHRQSNDQCLANRAKLARV